MPDTGKVIKGLECHRIDNNHRIICADCPYCVNDDNHIQCVNDLHDDAIALLKDQNGLMLALEQSNAVNGFLNAEVERLNGLLKEYQEKQEGLPPAWQDRTQEHICQKCGGIVWQEDNYCSKCGQKVKWNE